MPVNRDARTPKPPGSLKTKLNLSVSKNLHRRLTTYARFHGRTVSDLVTEWATHGMRGFHVSQKPSSTADPVGQADEPAADDGQGLRIA